MHSFWVSDICLEVAGCFSQVMEGASYPYQIGKLLLGYLGAIYQHEAIAFAAHYTGSDGGHLAEVVNEEFVGM